VSKQRELCLQPAHFGCATYQAARQVSADAKTPADGGLWPETRGAVLSLETARGARTALPGFAGRTSGQAALIALMVLAFVLLAITRVSPPLSADVPSPADAGAIVSPAPGASGSPVAPASPTVSPSPTPAATPTVPPSSAPSGDASPAAGSSGSPAAGSSGSPAAGSSGSPAPTSAASPTPASSPGAPSPSAGATTYRVQGGDTLSGIAARFGVTVRALKAANGITNVALIRPGQVLVIPH
jgi:LysM repeat protein